MANLTRWNTNRDPRTLDNVVNDLWGSMWNMHPDRFATDTTRALLRPAMDVVEHEDGITIRVDLPGLNPDDVNVEIDGDTLTISGELPQTEAQEGERYHHRERRYGAFKRSLRLGDTIDADNAEATFQHGVLSLHLPKRPEAQPKRIKVETAS